MVVHSPTDEWLDPYVWEFWAMLFSTVAMAVVGYLAALKEDQERQARRQRRSSMPQRSVPRRPSRQRSISYRLPHGTPPTTSPGEAVPPAESMNGAMDKPMGKSMGRPRPTAKGQSRRARRAKTNSRP